MSKFAGSIPRLNTASINAGALAVAELQGRAEGGQQSGFQRALSFGVSALRAREEALTKNLATQRAQSQLEAAEQKMIRDGILFEQNKEQEIIQTQRARFQLDEMKKQSEMDEQFNQAFSSFVGGGSSFEGVPGNRQEQIVRFRNGLILGDIPTSNRKQEQQKAIADRSFQTSLNETVQIDGLERFGIPSGSKTMSEIFTMIGQERNPELSDFIVQALQELDNNPFSQAEAQSLRNVGIRSVKRRVVPDLPLLPGEQSGLSFRELSQQELGSLLSNRAKITKQLEEISNTVFDDAEITRQSQPLQFRLDKIDAALSRENVVPVSARIDTGTGTAFDDLISPDEVPPATGTPPPPPPEEEQPDTSVTDRRLSAQLTEAREQLRTLPPGRDRASQARLVNQLESRIETIPTDIQRVENRLIEARESLETATGRQRVSLGPVISRLEGELSGLREDRVSLQESALAGEDFGIST